MVSIIRRQALVLTGALSLVLCVPLALNAGAGRKEMKKDVPAVEGNRSVKVKDKGNRHNKGKEDEIHKKGKNKDKGEAYAKGNDKDKGEAHGKALGKDKEKEKNTDQEHGKALGKDKEMGSGEGLAVGKDKETGPGKRLALGKHKTGRLAKEQRKHLKRMAKIERLETVATEAKKEALLERVKKLREKETARHEKAMARIQEKTGAGKGLK